MKTANQKIGLRIQQFRKGKKMLQSDLAGKVNLNANTISSYERGVIQIPRSRLEDIAEALEVTLSELLGNVEQSEAIEAIEPHIAESTPLNVSELSFISSIIEKAMTLNAQERAKLINNLKFAIKFFDDGSI